MSTGDTQGDQGGSFYDDRTMDALAQNASGGVCAMAVIDVIELATVMPVTGYIEETYGEVTEPGYGFVVPDFVSLEPKRRTFGDIAKMMIGIAPERAPDNRFKALSPHVTLECGIDVEIGMNGNTLGALTCEATFVPLVDFHDARNRTDILCGTATLRHGTLLDPTGINEISTIEDEKTAVIAARSEQGYVLAVSVLRDIAALQADADPKNAPKTDEEKETHQAMLERLFDCLGVNTAVMDAFKLSPARSYAQEQGLRLNVRRVIEDLRRTNHELPDVHVIAVDAQEYEEKPSRNHVLTTKLDLSEPEQPVITQDLVFEVGRPDSREISPLIFRLGRRIGEAVIASCVENDRTVEGVSADIAAMIDAMYGEAENDQPQEDLLPAPSADRSRTQVIELRTGGFGYGYPADDPERITNGFGLERSTVWYDMTEYERVRATRIAFALGDKFKVSPEDFRTVAVQVSDVDEVDYVVVYAGQTGFTGKKYVKAARQIDPNSMVVKLKQKGPNWVDVDGKKCSTQYWMKQEVYGALADQLRAEGSTNVPILEPTVLPAQKTKLTDSTARRMAICRIIDGKAVTSEHELAYIAKSDQQYRPAVLINSVRASDS